MANLDKHYLLLQFRDRIYQKNATEFQSFFEDIMGKAVKGFVKIAPYGSRGDGGNDGYIPDKGIYYQAYAPKNPREKDADAAKKFKDDFDNAKKNWDQISKVKQYNFVFNDKYNGSSIELEQVKAELRQNNPEIEFEIFRPKDLEDVFLGLGENEILSLGFDINSRNALQNVRDHIKQLEIDLDRGNAGFVIKVLGNIKNVVLSQNDEALLLDYEIIEAKALQKNEKVKEAREKYENIFKRYPKDPRAPLFLAEICLNNDDFDKNKALIEKAELIDPDYWLLNLEKLIREYRLGGLIDISKVNEKDFPSDIKIKSDYYRIYSLFFQKSGDKITTNSFIERATELNPNKFSGFGLRLSYLEEDLFQKNNLDIQSDGNIFIQEVERIRGIFSAWDGPGIRNNAALNIKKFHIFVSQENYAESERIATETLGLVMVCYFDHEIDCILVDLLRVILLPEEKFSKLLGFLQASEKQVSEDLSKGLMLQFAHNGLLETEGKCFLEKAGKKELVQFISDLENKDYDKALQFVLSDVNFATAFSIEIKSHSEFRKKIIESLPSDGKIQKEKLKLLVNYQDGFIDEAFSILKNLDLSKLNYAECKPALEIAEKKKAWDFMVIILEKLLKYEKNTNTELQMKLKLFTANYNLERFPEVIRIGQAILGNDGEIKLLDDINKEILLAQTIYAWMKRSKYPEALELAKKYSPFFKTFEAKISVEAEVYLKNNDPTNALKSVIDAVKTIKQPSAEQYGNLFFVFSQIGNLMDFLPKPQDEVAREVFIKFKGKDGWYFLGDGDNLDAINILKERETDFIGKKIGENVILGNKYSSERSEYTIENILPIDKYVLYQSIHNAELLSKDQLWDKMERIEVPTTESGIDTKYLKACLEDQSKRGQEFFDTYCQKIFPLAILAVSENGLTNAIGRIASEGKGFIRCNDGSPKEMDEQKETAKQVIDGQPFYIDGTSAFVLSESGLLEKIFQFLPNIKIPQSVISLLLDVIDKLNNIPGQVGYMRYINGRIEFSSANPEKKDLARKNFEASIKILERRSENIEAISSANKSKTFLEEKIPSSLSDAYILSQRNSLPVLTEDFIYLKINEIETGKRAPQYFSAFALVRVLYEQGKVSFDDYLNFFEYLSLYRFIFLPITIDDLMNAILGAGPIKQVQVGNLRKFNFPLTLSKEYGVTIQISFVFIGKFLTKILYDDSIVPGIAEQIFAEIISNFPTDQDRKILGRELINFSSRIIEIKKSRGSIILGLRTQEKIDLLQKFIQTYSSGKFIAI